MNTVFLVDGVTRLHLPNTKWAFEVRTELQRQGHDVRETAEPDYPDTRSEAELARRDALLEKTGL
jgi:hypothetical protein